MSRVTYPHLGTLHITAEHFFRALGLEPITPPSPTRRTLDLGVTHCPEMTCAPCKILFGNYYEGLELGADRLVLFGGPDTCRLGYLARPHAQQPVRIAGRCTVFAESDMIHKQQMGHRMEDILYGLCQALARNFLNNLALGKELRPPVVFQGGVAANAGMVRAFEETLEMPVLVPPHYEVMGRSALPCWPTSI